MLHTIFGHSKKPSCALEEKGQEEYPQMSHLYNKLAPVYHEMYQQIFDYQKEFEIYKEIFDSYSCKKILELGCGSGCLSKFFIDSGYDYYGIDISGEMLAIARKNNPSGRFQQQDMKKFVSDVEFDAVLISGRSFCYMTSNNDVNSCLTLINKCLIENGVLVFDNFNAKEIFRDFKKHSEFNAVIGNKKIKRTSNNTLNLESGWTWNWNAEYIIEEPGKETEIIHDSSILRAFIIDELELFLTLNKFEVIQTIQKDSWFRTIAIKKAK